MNYIIKIFSIVFSLSTQFLNINYNYNRKIDLIEKRLLTNNNVSNYLFTFSENESRKWHNYTIEDFSNIDCLMLKDLTESLNPKSENKVSSNDLESFNRIIKCSINGKLNESQIHWLKTNFGIEIIEEEGIINFIDENIEYNNMNQCYIQSANNIPSYHWAQDIINLDEAKQIIDSHLTESPEYKLKQADIGILEYDIQKYHLAFNNKNLSVINYDGTPSYSNGSNNELINHGTKVTGIIIGSSYSFLDNYYNLRPINDQYANVPLIKHPLGLSGEYLSYKDELIEAISQATSMGLRVLNCSFGYSKVGENDSTLKVAFQNFPGLLVCGAGNEGNDNDGENPIYPASYGFDNIISVGAINCNDNLLYKIKSFSEIVKSNWGAESVDVFAPGEDIYMVGCTSNADLSSCMFDSGTSYAAPFVTGLASLLISIEETTPYNFFTTNDLKEIIMTTVRKSNSLDGKCKSNGCIDFKAAIEEAYSNKIVGYEYYDDNYHTIIKPYGASQEREEHDWKISIANYVSPSRLTCSKCGVSKITL